MPGRSAGVETINLQHLRRLTDDTGMIQHAVGAVPDRRTGYTTDDNARALQVAVRAAHAGDPGAERLAEVYLSFLLYAQEEDGWFHNFFSYDRRKLPEVPSEDCQGRALWALAVSARHWEGREHGWVAARMFGKGLQTASRLESPRGMAGLITACAEWLEGAPHHRDAVDPAVSRRAEEWLDTAAHRLASRFERASGRGWYWCEDVVTYDNGMLPYALLRAARHTDDRRLEEVGLKALSFLSEATFSNGKFCPIGNRGWYRRGEKPARFDQQALEATAMVFACSEAARLTGDTAWDDRAHRALRWFLGDNIVGRSLYDPETGGCYDGLQPDGVNRNQGAESTLAWLMAVQTVPAAAVAA